MRTAIHCARFRNPGIPTAIPERSFIFREVAELLAKMDRLVLRFRRDEPGTRFAAAWQAARIIRDLGGSAPAAPAAPATPPAP